NQPFKVADFKPFDWKIDQKNNIAELAGMGSNITGNIRGWQMQLENTNLAYVPFDTFYSASGKVQTNFLGNNLTADIFDAGVRYGYGADGKLTGETSLALIGRGAAFDALPGMYSSQVDPNAPQPLSQKFTSFSHYTLDLTKDMRVGSLGGNNLEWVLPGQDVIAKELAQKGAIVAGISSNNFGVGAEAIFGNSITKDSPLHMYGIDFAKDKMLDDKSFWGAGVRFGASEITPLAFDKKTYFNERQVLNSSPFGAVSLGQFTGGLLAEDLAVGKIPGWSYSGTRAQGWQFDQSLTPAHQALSIQGLYGTTNILTDAYTENYTALFANKGQEILYTSGIAAKGGLSNTAEDFGGSFLTRELNRGVYVSKVLEDASHFANINIPQTLATPQQLMSPNNNLWAYDTMFSNAHHTYTGEIKDFVARVGINEQGKVFEEFIAAAAKDRGRLADLTAPVFLNERGFADTLGAVSRYQGVDGSKVLLDVKSVNDIPALARLHEVSFERGGMPFADALNPLKGFDDVSFDGGRNWQKVSAWIDSGKLLFSNDQSMPRLPVYIATAANSHVALERDLSGPQSAENPGLTAKDLTALAARPYNVHADGNTAKGQHIELLLNSNFSGGMQLDQRAMNYHSAGKLNDFATITDGERTPSVLGRMSMIDGNQVVYFDPSGASMISGTGKFLVSSTNPNGLYLDHVYETNGARTHGGIRYDDLTFEYKFKGEGDTARQYVFAHDVTQHGNNFEYSIHHPAVGIMDGKTTYDKLSALKTGEFAGSLHLKNVAEMAFIAPQLRAESDVAEAYKNSVAQRTAQVDAVREQLRKEMGDAALTALKPQEIDVKIKERISAMDNDLGRITRTTLAANPDAKLPEIEKAYDSWARTQTNAHQVDLLAGGIARNQWLVSTLQTPFSAGLSQDQVGLILNNQAGDRAFYANVVDPSNKLTSQMSASAGSLVYFNQQGQLDYFTGINYLNNVDGKGQLIVNTFEDAANKLHVGGYRVNELAMTHSLRDEDRRVHLDVLRNGTKFFDHNYADTTDGIKVHTTAFGGWDVVRGLSRDPAKPATQGDIRLLNVENLSLVPPQLRAESDVAEAYKNSVAQRTAQVDAVREQLRKEMGDAALTALKPQEIDVKIKERISAMDNDLGRITRTTLAANPDAKLPEIEKAYDSWARTQTNAHQVDLLAGGIARNQWLVSTLQTPFSAGLSQDQVGLILNNQAGDRAFYANVVDPSNKLTSQMSASAGSLVYFNQQGQLDYFTGINYLNNVDGKGQLIVNTFEDAANKLHVGGYRVNELAMTHSLRDEDRRVHLDVLRNGTKFFDHNYADTTDGIKVHTTAFGGWDVVRGLSRDPAKPATQGDIRLLNVENLSLVPPQLLADAGALDAHKTLTDQEQQQRTAFEETKKADTAYQGLDATKKDRAFMEWQSQQDSDLGRVTKDVLTKNPEAKIADVSAAFQDFKKTQANYHAVELLPEGKAANQWLISSLQTPFSAGLSQDQVNLHLVNHAGDKAFYANVADRYKPYIKTATMSADNNSNIYFDRSGQLEFFTLTNYLKEATPGEGQFIANSFRDQQNKLNAGGYWAKELALAYDLRPDGKTHLDVIFGKSSIYGRY
ncbi:MAG: hypothetical protein PHD09_05345, partial [Candidatus Omnitrophica bacterium]|nr:hypothetical protein [Candidatus Omnitrophota bacterium]